MEVYRKEIYTVDQNSYRNLISGKDKGFWKSVLRCLLCGISYLYLAAIWVRNFFYNRGWIPTYGAAVPVISVGNITTGGTGKTPLVIWLCKMLEERSLNCAILTRGYKAEQGKLTDEPAILNKSCPDARIIVDPDRVRGAAKAITDYSADVLIMDDGFQHRRLRRDLDILAIDATCPFGYNRILPAGFLREPVTSIRRADAVVITRYDRVKPNSVEQLVETIQLIRPGIVIAKAVHKHPFARMIKGDTLSIDELKEMKVFVFCGIGNPDAFLSRLDEYGINLVGSRIYNDHYDYDQNDIAEIYAQAEKLGAELILSTQKDWVKTALLSFHEDILFAYMALELEFVEGVDKITSLIDDLLIEKPIMTAD